MRPVRRALPLTASPCSTHSRAGGGASRPADAAARRLELAERMRAHPTWTRVPLVVVAAHYAIAEEAARVGARAWLHKPASLDDLVGVVNRVYDESTDEVAS